MTEDYGQRKLFVHSKTTWFILAFILAVATVLRLYELDFQSLWNDELASWKMSRYFNLSAVISEAIHDVHPPGYHILLHYWITYLGDSEQLLRIPSALAGVAAVAAVFLLGVHLYTSREGLLASAIMAVLWCPIFYSQMARVYSLLILVILVNVFFWVRLIEEILDGRDLDIVKHVLPYIVVSTLAAYLHYYSLIIIGLQAIIWGAVTALWRSRLRWFLITYVVIFVAYLPWAMTMISHMNTTMSWFSRPKPMYFIYYLQFFFNKSVPILLIATVTVIASASELPPLKLDKPFFKIVTRQRREYHDEAKKELYGRGEGSDTS